MGVVCLFGLALVVERVVWNGGWPADDGGEGLGGARDTGKF